MDMETNEISVYFTELGFEETEIEDNQTALCFEEAPEGEYVLLTDEEGKLPASLTAALTLACYTAENAFLWSVGFKDAARFQAVWSQGSTYAEKIRQAHPQR